MRVRIHGRLPCAHDGGASEGRVREGLQAMLGPSYEIVEAGPADVHLLGAGARTPLTALRREAPDAILVLLHDSDPTPTSVLGALESGADLVLIRATAPELGAHIRGLTRRRATRRAWRRVEPLAAVG